MKKAIWLCFALAVIMLFSGCGNTSTTSKSNSGTSSSSIMSSSSITSKYENPVIPTGITELYRDAFVTLYEGFGETPFSEVKKKAEGLKAKGYEVKFIEPDDRTLAQVFVTAADGDVVYVQCCQDFHKEDGIDRVFLIQYEHGEYHICISDALFSSKYSYEIGDPNTENGFYHVDTFDECRQFMFGK